VNVIYGRKLQDADDPEKEAHDYVEELQRGSAPWEAAVEIVLESQKVMGAYGCAEEYDMERYARDI